jgi:hypothetical protein
MSAEIARTGDPLVLDRASLAHLSVRDDRACQAAAESVAAAERTGNPSSLAWALCVYVQVMELADPHAALAAGRRAVQVSVDSLSRANENVALQFLAPAEGAIGDPVAECDFLARGLSLSMDADNHIGGAAALGRVAIALYRRGHHAEAARLYGTCAANIDPAFVPGVPEAADGLRSAIGPERFKHLATEGAATSVAGAMRQALAHIVGGRELPIVHQLPSAPPAS